MAELDDMASLEDLIATAAAKLKQGESAECLRAVRAAEQILNREKWLLATKRANLDKALRILREHVRPDPLSGASRAVYRPIRTCLPSRF